MNRLKVLINIDELNEVYNSSTVAEKKAIDKKLKLMRQHLINPRRQNKIDLLKRKGDLLTYQEIMWLSEQEVTKKELAKIVNMSFYSFNDYLKTYQEVNTVAKGNLEEAIRLLKETDMSVMDISRKTGVVDATAYYHAKKIRDPEKEVKASVPDQAQKLLKDLKELKEDRNRLANLNREANADRLKRDEIIEKQAKIIDKLHEKIDSLQIEVEKRPSEIQNQPSPSDLAIWKEKFANEKAAHRHLFEYISFIRKVPNG